MQGIYRTCSLFTSMLPSLSPLLSHLPCAFTCPFLSPFNQTGYWFSFAVLIFQINFQSIQNSLLCPMRFCWLITPSHVPPDLYEAHSNKHIRSVFLLTKMPPQIFFSNFIILRMNEKNVFSLEISGFYKNNLEFFSFGQSSKLKAGFICEVWLGFNLNYWFSFFTIF